ncbi:unnamed protein product [Amoebophrya sp. A25]|nr:unnamed protein product [Amoebophrya sp. A25]|eukprot:GSA25T00007322001.1
MNNTMRLSDWLRDVSTIIEAEEVAQESLRSTRIRSTRTTTKAKAIADEDEDEFEFLKGAASSQADAILRESDLDLDNLDEEDEERLRRSTVTEARAFAVEHYGVLARPSSTSTSYGSNIRSTTGVDAGEPVSDSGFYIPEDVSPPPAVSKAKDGLSKKEKKMKRAGSIYKQRLMEERTERQRVRKEREMQRKLQFAEEDTQVVGKKKFKLPAILEEEPDEAMDHVDVDVEPMEEEAAEDDVEDVEPGVEEDSSSSTDKQIKKLERAAAIYKKQLRASVLRMKQERGHSAEERESGPALRHTETGQKVDLLSLSHKCQMVLV